jgi:hypothetical protein
MYKQNRPWHFDNEQIVMVRMTFPAHHNPSVQMFDSLQVVPPESYPHVYHPELASLNRLLKAVHGWSCFATETGAWEWRKP